jgi:DNA-binding MarR family transcriptional regulator
MLASKQLSSFIFLLSSSTPIATRLDAEATARLRSVIGRLQRLLRVTSASVDAGLTPTRSSLLLSVDRRGPVRLSELGEVEGLNPTMLSRSVTQLVDQGLVQRTSDDSDRRAAWVSATDAGHALAQQLRAQRTEALNHALEGLSEAQRRTIERSIDALESLADQLKGQLP